MHEIVYMFMIYGDENEYEWKLFEEAIKEDCDLEYISECCWTYF